MECEEGPESHEGCSVRLGRCLQLPLLEVAQLQRGRFITMQCVIRGMYQPREICGKERSAVNKKTNQHLEAEQTDSREGPRPPGMLDHKQNPSTCLEAKIEAVCRADHWG